MKPIWIELVNSGVANRFENEDHELIEMNWRLTMYPELYQKVYEHELGHNHKVSDLKHDMMSRTPGLFKFMGKHISSWTMLLPIYWDRSKNEIVYDWDCIISWWLLICSTAVVYFMMGWITYIVRNGIW